MHSPSPLRPGLSSSILQLLNELSHPQILQGGGRLDWYRFSPLFLLHLSINHLFMQKEAFCVSGTNPILEQIVAPTHPQGSLSSSHLFVHFIFTFPLFFLLYLITNHPFHYKNIIFNSSPKKEFASLEHIEAACKFRR